MKLLLTLIDWEYPSTKKIPTPELWELNNNNNLMQLYLAFANGIIIELRAIGDCEDAIGVIRGLAMGAGSCKKSELSIEQKDRIWLYQDGDESYIQGNESGFIFVDPIPQPDKFNI